MKIMGIDFDGKCAMSRKEKRAFTEKKREAIRSFIFDKLREFHQKFPGNDQEAAFEYASGKVQEIVDRNPQIKNLIDEAVVSVVQNLTNMYSGGKR